MKPTLWSRRRHRPVALLAAAAAAVGGLIALTPQTAGADTAPAAGMPTTVAATGLPTMQVNGIVWAQVTVGNTVYATGNFTKARPAGSAVGQNETPVGNIVAYDITTGKMITSFVHSMNNQGLSIAATPDGKTIYVGGDFTTIDGKTRNHIAAFSTATGTLVSSFAPYVGSSARALVATDSTIYVGGSFAAAGGQARNNLAAFTSAGALTSWAPTADNIVQSMVMSPDKSRIIIGGRFYTLNRAYAAGMGAVDVASGASLTWFANQTIVDWGNGPGIDGLSTDGKLIYGAGVAPGGGQQNFEGRFAANPSDGRIVWLNDCHGDTYATLPLGQVLYSVGHAHDCSAVGSFPDYFPANEDHHRALAETTYADGTNSGPDAYGWNFAGMPKADVLDWFPKTTAAPATPPAGTVAVSGSEQAGWALTSNASGTYLAIGGEFTAVNNSPQQALTRFAMPSVTNDAAGNKNNEQGPVSTSITQPTAIATGATGAVAVTFTAAWDRDNQTLTYQLFRDGGATAVDSRALVSTFWQQPNATLTDTTAPAGKHTYVVQASDPFGNSRSYPAVSATVTNGYVLTGGSVTNSLVYSTDGGKSWTTTPTVSKGSTVLVREYYNNTKPGAVFDTSLKTALPTGFTRVTGTTTVCLNPGTTDPTHPTGELACNTDTSQGGAITENAVWNGNNLTISPTAGIEGQSTAATAGLLAMGKKHYLNLANCAYSLGSIWYTSSINAIPYNGGSYNANATGASNTAATDPQCGPGGGATPFSALTGVQNINLLGNRYANLANCAYASTAGTWYGSSNNAIPYSNGAYNANATGASNTAATDPQCGPGGGATPFSALTGVQNIDTLANRYINLANCTYSTTTAWYTSSNNAVPYNSGSYNANATGASNTAATDPQCGPGGGATLVSALSGVQNIDLLDQTRGQGFVQFTMKAPATAATVTQTATVTGAAAAAKATIKVS